MKITPEIKKQVLQEFADEMHKRSLIPANQAMVYKHVTVKKLLELVACRAEAHIEEIETNQLRKLIAEVESI